MSLVVIRPTALLNTNSVMPFSPVNFQKISEQLRLQATKKLLWIGKYDRKKSFDLSFLFPDMKVTWIKPA